MNELLTSLATSGDKLSVAGLLMAGFVFLLIALYREWIVMGGPYRKCMAQVAEFQDQATKRAEVNEAKTARLEDEFRAFKSSSETTIAQLKAENDLLRDRRR